MPIIDRERRLQEEGQRFCRSKSFYPLHCKHFQPSLKEIQSTLFSDFVRYTVLRQSEEGYDDDEEEEEAEEKKEMLTKQIHCANNPKIGYDYGK